MKKLIIVGILIIVLAVGVLLIFLERKDDDFESFGGLESHDLIKKRHNSYFAEYEGKEVSGANVKYLIRNIISNNTSNAETGQRLVSISIDGTEIKATLEELNTSEMSKAFTRIKNGSMYTYTVVLEYNDAGLVNKAIITTNRTVK